MCDGTTAFCGNDQCESTESCTTCAADCGTCDAFSGSCEGIAGEGSLYATVTEAQADELPDIVAGAPEGATILLEDGTYTMDTEGEMARRLQFRTEGVTLRGKSMDATKVVIDGEYVTNEIVSITASNVTIADLTIKRANHHLVHVSTAGTAVVGTRLHRLRLIDSRQQFVKINTAGDGFFTDFGTVSCSEFEMTSTGRQNAWDGCYTGGIDAHTSRGWHVWKNSFDGIHCDSGLAEHAVHFWTESRDTIVEQNEIRNCARGIGFGLTQSDDNDRDYADNPYPEVASYIGHYDGIIRNNLIYADPGMDSIFDTGIELAQARGALIYHNTVASDVSFRSIDVRYANSLATIKNNIFRTNINQREGGQFSGDHNVTEAESALFVDADSGDYRLDPAADGAIDAGVDVSEAGLDLFGNAHDVGAPDIGAHELQP